MIATFIDSPAFMSAGVSFAVAFLVALAVVGTARWHLSLSADGASGVQKFHSRPTPRIGGLATLSGLVVVATALASMGGAAREAAALVGVMLVVAAPAALAGFEEDITKAVSPRRRLIAALASGALFAVYFEAGSLLVDVQWIHEPRLWSVTIGIGIVTIGVAGLANAVNIIDGFHGLVAGYVVMTALAIGLLAAAMGDPALTLAALALAGAHAGFLLVNFPLGRLFLGDGGAYTSGACLAVLCVFLTVRNPDISPFVCVLLVFYPVFETLFSIWRKTRRRGHTPSQPDGVHFHMLVSRRVAGPLAARLGRTGWQNPLTGVMIWPLGVFTSAMAVASAGSGRFALAAMAVFALVYLRLYAVMSCQARSIVARSGLWRRSGS